jgi:hypothetical protein
MNNLYKANMKRITGNIVFIGGCIIAFLATFGFTANLMGMTGRFDEMGPERRMFFISIAMMGFFTIFVPLYTNAEYRHGVIRNKIAAGYSQKEIYFSHLFGHLTAMSIMMASYLLGGILGGARDFGKMAVVNGVLFFALCGYISTMMFISFRITKIVLVSIVAFMILNICYTGIMMGNMLISFVLEGAARYVGIIVYNMTLFGQWFSATGLADDLVNPGRLQQIVISIAVTLVMVFFATFGLEKRDLK